MAGKKNKSESYWSIIKFSVKKFIEIEGNGEGILNLIFGILIFFLIVLICVPNTAIYIIKAFYPSCDIIMPWYGILAFFIAGLVYFYYCSTKLMVVLSKRKIMNPKNK